MVNKTDKETQEHKQFYENFLIRSLRSVIKKIIAPFFMFFIQITCFIQ